MYRNLVLFFSLAFTGLLSAQQAEYLIIEFPAQLRIYDQYEMKLSSASSLPPNAPLRILENRVTLSDGFTAAMLVGYDKKKWYLAVDEKGKLQPENRGGSIDNISRAIVLDDTIQIIKQNKALIPVGTKIWRIFSSRQKSYGAILDAGPVFQWFTIPAGSWQKVQKTPSHFTSRPPTEQIISSFLDHVNKKYSRVYQYLNGQTGRSEPVPQWKFEQHNADIHFFLENPGNHFSHNSTSLLVKRLARLLPGYEMTSSDNSRITFSPPSR